MPTPPDELLPDVLRSSWLPWHPDFDDQAPAPRDGDSWTATLGSLELRLCVSVWLPDHDDPLEETSTTVELRLWNLLTNRELSSWHLESLREASTSAEALLRTRLDDLLTEARRRLQHAA